MTEHAPRFLKNLDAVVEVVDDVDAGRQVKP
jgi:hypothetical protein